MSSNIGKRWQFRGFCLSVPKQKDMDIFKRLISEVLPKYDCNALVFLIRYRYQFRSHPEVSDKEPLIESQAKEIGELCRQNDIRIIPKMNLLGHQSWRGAGLEGLLRAHPEFDETPDQPEVRYCRSICPRHPNVKEVIFDLADELIDAFEADAIHVGLDEVFEIGLCPRCKGTPNSVLFAEWVKALHDHFVKEKGVEMLMWSDRLLDGEATGYGEWEASLNNTWQNIDEIPKDIIMCDWHYGKRESYPSIPYFISKGFRVLACPWRELEATRAFMEYVADKDDKFLGVLQTSWCDSGMVARYLCDGDPSVDDVAKQVGESFKFVMTF